MKVMILNGPNLNMLGKREPDLYGNRTLEQVEQSLTDLGSEWGVEVECFQSNMEGELASALNKAPERVDGVILNAGAYTHTSIAIRDAVLCCSVPVVEVHLSNPHGREPFRRVNLLSDVCSGSIAGFGETSYELALLWFARQSKKDVD